jgi:hypothetical protein
VHLNVICVLLSIAYMDDGVYVASYTWLFFIAGPTEKKERYILLFS